MACTRVGIAVGKRKANVLAGVGVALDGLLTECTLFLLLANDELQRAGIEEFVVGDCGW
jgi:hypothetical protein